jgi:predicted DsbA family dithiol-disulfide isomerase
MEPIRIIHFSDALCVWAYVSQIRYDELMSNFAGRVSIDYRYLHVFGAVATKMEAAWGGRGGVRGYADHVRGVVAGFEHVTIHPDVWVANTPASSMPGHLLLCALRRLEKLDELPAGTQASVARALRQAFFTECADVSDRSVLFAIAERCGVHAAALERQLDGGAAHAALCEDLDLAREYAATSSPTLLLNEGRQRLVGNVGYRILEANVRELLERPGIQHSWC